ncbi:hypothetical protein KR009_006605 [Drosophila setifemur]|nr:hypothetical protein KR009_006605 [Drosophila setifemur]
MEVHPVKISSLHCTKVQLSQLRASSPTAASTNATSMQALPKNVTVDSDFFEQGKQQDKLQEEVDTDNQSCPIPTSSSTKLEKDFNEISVNKNGSITGTGCVEKSNGSLSCASLTTSASLVMDAVESGIANGSSSGTVPLEVISAAAYNKKRISSSRTPTRKAHRIKFYRNGDRFYPGITIPVSNERYRSFESLFEDLTRVLEENVKIPGAVRTIYNMCGKKVSCSRRYHRTPSNHIVLHPQITALDELEDGQSYVCSCNNENFKKVEYNTSSQPLTNLALANNGRCNNNRLAKLQRPASPLKNGSLAFGSVIASSSGGPTNCSPYNTSRFNERASVVHPRIVTLIRNGTKPRRIMRLLLNKRNSPSFDHVLTAITQVVRLDTGYVRKVFTLAGSSVIQLADFFDVDDIFFVYGTERVHITEDFKLEAEEQRAINAIRKTLRTAGTICKGPKPKMPVKSKKVFSPLVGSYVSKETRISVDEQQVALLNSIGVDIDDFPSEIRANYTVGQIIGDGNFAIVLKIKNRRTCVPYALKIIDKSKCKGKEHYIDAEVRVMKKLDHPHIISLLMDVDQQTNMYLVLEYVSGGDLFDAITQVTRFSESQTRIMIRHLGSAMSYLHSMGIVHRDIKPENLLVELDEHGSILELKLADFGLACEVTEPLYAVCGTPTYVAPEILLEVGYGLKIDVWAAGIILYILLCGFPPFVAPDNHQEPLFDAIISGVYEFPDPYWSDIGDGVRDLIANMLQSDPDVRFTSEDILDHYWTMDNEENGCGNSKR